MARDSQTPPQWSARFLVAWCGCLVTILAFDLLWCSITSYRAMSYLHTYIYGGALALIMALPALLSKSRWPQLAVMLLFDLLLMANLMYCRTYYDMIPAASYKLAGNVAQFTDSILAAVGWWDFALPVIAVATVWLMPGRPSRFPLKSYLVTMGAFAVVCVLCVLPYGGLSKHIAWMRNSAYFHALPPAIYTLPVALFEDLRQGMHQTPQAEIDRAREVIGEREALARQYENAGRPDSLRRDNLVMVLVESLEAWPIGSTYKGREITPNINRWLEDSTTWFARRVASQVGSGRSIDGQLLMTTGLYPTSRFVYSMEYPESTYPSLAREISGANGAETYLLTGDRPNTWNQALMARAFGLEHTLFRDDWDCTEYFGNHRNPTDKSLYRQITDRMRTGEIWPEGQNAVVEIVTFSSHNPWKIDPEARPLAVDRAEAIHPLLASYIEAMAYIDSALPILVDYLRSRPDWDRTMVVIVGDHEGLANERREMRSASPQLAEIVDQEEYVPMIVLNSPVGGRREQVMGQIDVYSTILDLMGVTPQWPGLGFSAFSPLSPDYAAGPVSKPAEFSQPADSLARRVQNVVKAQPAAGNTIISADLLRK